MRARPFNPRTRSNFVLGGARRTNRCHRFGSDFAVVQAVFEDYLTPSVSAYLQDIGVECEDVLIIRRKMSVDGKNECRINGRVSTLSILKGLTELLVDIHGQHEHNPFLKHKHTNCLTDIGAKRRFCDKGKDGESHAKYVALKKELSRFGDESERERKT